MFFFIFFPIQMIGLAIWQHSDDFSFSLFLLDFDNCVSWLIDQLKDTETDFKKPSSIGQDEVVLVPANPAKFIIINISLRHCKIGVFNVISDVSFNLVYIRGQQAFEKK